MTALGVGIYAENDTIVDNSGMVKFGTVSFKARCDRHPGFDPNDGRGGVRGGCKRCELLLDIHDTHARLMEMIRKARNEMDPVRPKAAAAAADERQTLLF
jgi:hypothetical protein